MLVYQGGIPDGFVTNLVLHMFALTISFSRGAVWGGFFLVEVSFPEEKIAHLRPGGSPKSSLKKPQNFPQGSQKNPDGFPLKLKTHPLLSFI